MSYSPPEALFERDVRRQQIAAWIKSAVQPVSHLTDSGHASTVIDTSENIESTSETENLDFEVREYQLDAWGALWDARKAGADRGLVHLATGLGKTSVGVFDAIKFREEFQTEHGYEPKILFAVHQNDILEQAADRFRSFMPDASIGFYNGFSKDKTKNITFATLQSLYANLGSFEPNEFDYIINDEVHHAKAETFEEVIEYFKPVFRLGLTATPNRADEKDIRDLYGNELFSKGLADALAEGWLAAPDYRIVFDDAVKEAMQSGFKVDSLRALQELFSIQPRNDVIAKNIKEEMGKIGLEFGSVKTILFCQNIEHAEDMARLLGGKAYHSEIDTKDRQQIFDDFKNGALQVITTRDMFNEGVDIPDARLLVFLRSTSSQTIFEQQLGRGLRKAANKQRVSVLDFVANVDRIALVQELADSVASKSSGNNEPENSDAIDDSEANAKSNRFAVHTEHGDFDFDKLTIDLLTKYQVLMSRPEASSDYINEGVLELELKRGRGSLRVIAESLGISRIEMRGKNRAPGFYYSFEDAVRICEANEAIETAPEDFMNFKQLEKAFGISHHTARKIAGGHGLEPKSMVDGANRVGLYFTPDEYSVIITEFNEKESTRESTDKSFLSAKDIAELTNYSYFTIKKIADELGLKGLKGITKQGRYGTVYPTDQLQIIVEAAAERRERGMPEGWMSVNDMAKDFRLSGSVIKLRMEQMGIAGEAKRSLSGKLTTYYDETAVAAFRNTLAADTTATTPAPDDMVSVPELMKALEDITESTLTKIIGNNDIEVQWYLNDRGRATRFLSTADAATLRLILAERPPVAPDDHEPLRLIAVRLGVAESTVKQAAKEAGVDSVRMLSKKQKTPGAFFSPESIEKIEAKILIPIKTEDYMTAAEIAAKTGVSQSNINYRANKLGITPQLMRASDSARKLNCYSPEQIEEILR